MRLSVTSCISATAALIVFAVPIAAQNRTDRAAPIRREVTISERFTKQDRENIQLVIGQLHDLKAVDVPLKLDSVRKFYEPSTKWSKLDQSTADFHIEAASTFARCGRIRNASSLVSVSDLVYRRIIDNTEGRTQLKASSSYCVQLLRQKRIDTALDTMRGVEAALADESVDPVARSRSLYNYGKALELAGNFERAHHKYELAMKIDPGFTKAVRSAAEMARESRSESAGIPQTMAATNVLLDQLDYEAVATNLRAAMQMDRWVPHDLHPQLVRQFVRYLTAANIDPNTFETQESDFLVRLQRRRPLNSHSRRMIRSIQDIYHGRLPGPNMAPRRSGQISDIWKESLDPNVPEIPFAFLSDFLKMVGDYYYGQPDMASRETALACYSHAWALNTKNMEAGLYVADILFYAMKNPDTGLDTNGYLLDEFIRQLFLDKNVEYLRVVGKDWERILKCHIVLASIFEDKERWGPLTDSRTALFQWQLAQNALRRLDRSKTATRKLLGRVVNNGFRKAQSQWENR